MGGLRFAPPPSLPECPEGEHVGQRSIHSAHVTKQHGQEVYRDLVTCGHRGPHSCSDDPSRPPHGCQKHLRQSSSEFQNRVNEPVRLSRSTSPPSLSTKAGIWLIPISSWVFSFLMAVDTYSQDGGLSSSSVALAQIVPHRLAAVHDGISVQ